jgi:AGCS family alanine or glycine:cation symporter
MLFLFGQRSVLPYKLVYCVAIILATAPGLIETDAELDAFTALGTGVMLWANIPIMLIFGGVAMRAYHDYVRRLDSGQMKGHAYPRVEDVVEGRDVR